LRLTVFGIFVGIADSKEPSGKIRRVVGHAFASKFCI
jgi:hypothetical protein